MSDKLMIFKKLSQVMKDVGSVGKDSTNTMQGYKFRGIDQLLNAAHPALVKNGVFITPKVLDSKVEIREVLRSSGKTGADKHVQLRVEFTFYAEDGSSVSSTTEGEGLDSGDKATNKAMSAALKYALIQTLAIPTEDMEDADRVTPELAQAVKPTTEKATTVPPSTVVAQTGGSASPPLNATSAVAQTTAAPRRSTSFRKPPKAEAAAPVVAVAKPLSNGVAKPSAPVVDEWS